MHATARFDLVDHDNWRGGTDTWALRISCGLAEFAALKARLPAVEAYLKDLLYPIVRPHDRDPVAEVTVAPRVIDSSGAATIASPTNDEVSRRWRAGMLRVFISHVTSDRSIAVALKAQLAGYGIDAFVSHEDISPTADWHREIELALQSMDALLAIVSSNFHESLWTDHEVGWAMGRGVLLLPISLGGVPYGLFGKIQSLRMERADSSAIYAVAPKVVDSIVDDIRCKNQLRPALVARFCGANSFAMAKELWRLVERLGELSALEKEAVWRACRENAQISGAFGVTDSVRRHIGGPPSESKPLEVPF